MKLYILILDFNSGNRNNEKQFLLDADTDIDAQSQAQAILDDYDTATASRMYLIGTDVPIEV